uniref:LigA n=1 Tax=Parastrongyloides trichosuri TaxID=131310 RepID=A0A0N4Z8D7_PARTI
MGRPHAGGQGRRHQASARRSQGRHGRRRRQRRPGHGHGDRRRRHGGGGVRRRAGNGGRGPDGGRSVQAALHGRAQSADPPDHSSEPLRQPRRRRLPRPGHHPRSRDRAGRRPARRLDIAGGDQRLASSRLS